MPKATFYNIDKDKRKRIIRCIIDEFSQNTYETASINQIVKTADIAKGSFYQYFEDKTDIYKMAIDICAEERKKYIDKVNENNRYLDDFSLIREICLAVIKFEIDEPKFSSIINKFYKNTDIELRSEVLGETDIDIKTEFKRILQEGIERGKIYYNVDVEFTSFLLENISRNTKEYFKLKRMEDKYINYEGFVNQAVDLVENGIKLKRKNNSNNIF